MYPRLSCPVSDAQTSSSSLFPGCHPWGLWRLLCWHPGHWIQPPGMAQRGWAQHLWLAAGSRAWGGGSGDPPAPGRSRCAQAGKQRQKQGMSGNKPNSFKSGEATLHILTKKLNKGKELSSLKPYICTKPTLLTNTAFQITVHRHGVVGGVRRTAASLSHSQSPHPYGKPGRHPQKSPNSKHTF